MRTACNARAVRALRSYVVVRHATSIKAAPSCRVRVRCVRRAPARVSTASRKARGSGARGARRGMAGAAARAPPALAPQQLARRAAVSRGRVTQPRAAVARGAPAAVSLRAAGRARARTAVSAAASGAVPAPRARSADVLFASDMRPIILFDGVCNMCNGGVNFALDYDQEGVFRFAALQSEVGRALLVRSGRRADDISRRVLRLRRGPRFGGTARSSRLALCAHAPRRRAVSCWWSATARTPSRRRCCVSRAG